MSLCALVGGLSCPSQTPRKATEPAVQESGDLALFFTGHELGALKPCGCSGGQLGGLSKRLAIFDRAPAERRVVVDAGGLVPGDGEQDLIKYRILFEAYDLLGYDAVHLTAHDVEIGRRLGLTDGQQYPFRLISADWGIASDQGERGWRKSFDIQGQEVWVNIIGLDARSASVDQAREFFAGRPGGSSVNLLILQNADAPSRQVWAVQSGAHGVLCLDDSEEPQLLNEPGTEPLIFTVGRYGRHIVRLDVKFCNLVKEKGLRFSNIPVAETLPREKALVRLYKQYQQLVSDSGLLESYPRLPLPQDLHYVGSKQCASCHEYAYAKWKTKAHADAFATLVEVGSDRDPECVICHVVGMDRASGYVNEERTPELKDVGCENCHGPGSEHVRTWGQTATTKPKMSCRDCHTPEHSSGYAGHEAEFLEKIEHWREP